MQRICRLHTILLLLVALFLILPAQTLCAGNQETTRVIVAKINGQPIFEDQIEARIEKNLGKNKRSSGLSISDNFPTLLKAQRDQALNEQIAAELFYQAGRQLELPDAEKKIAAEIAKHQKALTADQQKSDDEALKAYVSRRFYIDAYMEANDLINPQVPEAELRAYYEKTKQEYASKTDAVHVQHILIQTNKDASAMEQDQALKKIKTAQQLILGGAAFSEVAKEHSQDANAINGGDLGYIKPGYMPPEFDKHAFSMKPGEVSDIIKTPFGYHLLKVLDIKPKGSVPTYEKVKDFFGKYLSSELLDKKIPAHVQQLREKAKIEIIPIPDQGNSAATKKPKI